MKDQLRQIVQKYELKSQEVINFSSNDNSNSISLAQSHNHAFSLRSINELPFSKRSSLDKGIIQVDQQNERLRAFINRQEKSLSPPKLAGGPIKLKEDSLDRRVKVEAFEIKQDQDQDYEEVDLKTSIKSIDERLNALVG